MNRRRAFSLIEVMVACVVVGLAVGPLIGLLSSSNRTSGASVYEIMAVGYAEEIGEQLQRLAPRLKSISAASGGSSIKDILEAMNTDLGPKTPPTNDPDLLLIPGTNVHLFLSSLHPNFINRSLTVEAVTSATPSPTTIFKNGNFWKVTIGLSWKLNLNETVSQGASFTVILREDL